jgi:NADH dehydrogenase
LDSVPDPVPQKLGSFRNWDEGRIPVNQSRRGSNMRASASHCVHLWLDAVLSLQTTSHGVRVAFYLDMERPRIIIVGGGFGGLHAAQSLKRVPVDVTLLDRRNFHLFQPLLYQVATGWLSPANIASPLRVVLRNQENARVLLAEVIDFDLTNRQVILTDEKLGYDVLIVASGSGFHYFGHDEWQPLAPGLKTIEDATDIRRRIFQAFEAAERETDADETREWLTFVIVGGGPTGVELAGALGEIVQDVIRFDFREINMSDVSILLVEGADRILPFYPPDLSSQAKAFLARLNVTVHSGSVVEEICPDRVTIRSREKTETIRCRTVLWAAGVRASILGRLLGEKAGAQVDRAGRVMVGPDLTLPGHPEIFVIGDVAHARDPGGNSLPGVATVAIQQGRYVAKLLRNRLEGVQSGSFNYKDRGSMAIIGRAAAVADFGKFRLAGFGAWLMWLFVHLINLIEYQNRLLVLIQWSWAYFTHQRSARLITGHESQLMPDVRRETEGNRHL